MDFITRHYNPETDKAFIYNSYLSSFHKNFPIKFCPPTIYFANQTKILDQLIDNTNVSILLAVFPEDANEIMSYIIYQWHQETLVIHYCYTKFQFRRKYIITNLIKDIIGTSNPLVITTHYVDDFIALRHKLQMTYDPYLLARA